MIYVLSDNTALKIGYTSNLSSRIKQLQTGNSSVLRLLYLKEGDKSLESHLHSVLSDYHFRGEWFNNDPKIHEVINKLPDYSDSNFLRVNNYFFDLNQWSSITKIKENTYGIHYLYIYKAFQYSCRPVKEIINNFFNTTTRIKELILITDFCKLIDDLVKLTNDSIAHRLHYELQGCFNNPVSISFAELIERFNSQISTYNLFF